MALVFNLYIGFGPAPDEQHGLADKVFIEDDNRETLHQILLESDIAGYTCHEAVGVYRGRTETSAVVTVIEQDPEKAPIVRQELENVAKRYKLAAKQEEVWLTQTAQLLTIV